MSHRRKANPRASEFNSILARFAFALSVVAVGAVLLLRHAGV
jgi:hypothetical protein